MLAKLSAEFIGTFWLVLGGCGSAVLAAAFPEVGIGLVGVSLAFGLTVLTGAYALGPISGAHFNPAVTLSDASQGGLSWQEVPFYVAAQIIGAFVGVAAAHMMFELPLFFASRHARSGIAQALSEFVATFGLLAVIWGCARLRSAAVPFAVAAHITAAYWFTASTSFANPAVTLARSFTESFAGIRAADVAPFVAAQFAGAFMAFVVMRWLLRVARESGR